MIGLTVDGEHYQAQREGAWWVVSHDRHYFDSAYSPAVAAKLWKNVSRRSSSPNRSAEARTRAKVWRSLASHLESMERRRRVPV